MPTQCAIRTQASKHARTQEQVPGKARKRTDAVRKSSTSGNGDCRRASTDIKTAAEEWNHAWTRASVRESWGEATHARWASPLARPSITLN